MLALAMYILVGSAIRFKNTVKRVDNTQYHSHLIYKPLDFARIYTKGEHKCANECFLNKDMYMTNITLHYNNKSKFDSSTLPQTCVLLTQSAYKVARPCVSALSRKDAWYKSHVLLA